MSPGKQASPSEAAAPMAAGARLEAMRRRVRLSRVAVWTVIAAGPIALCVAVASTPTTVAAAPATKPTAVRTATAVTDPGGYAQVFISAWLRSDANDEMSAQARLAQSMAPDVELPDPAADAQSAPQSAVRSAAPARGRWRWLRNTATDRCGTTPCRWPSTARAPRSRCPVRPAWWPARPGPRFRSRRTP
ncbi:hypothetical protein GCM10023336_67450 [Streptomyces similanensis]|uniref:Uncharacterized protein n=1 Tax=Streptomyces similanensis TaxID=1274988 RepID=A0ABP9LID1_9ACTN